MVVVVGRAQRWLLELAMGGLAIVGAMGATAPALSQDIVKDAKGSLADLPAWKIPVICAKDSAQSHCLALESRAWRAVSGSWVSLPDGVKKMCLASAKTPADQSWRVLGDCIDEEMEKQGDKRAVATLRTPGEPVPPPKAAPAPVPVPVPAKVDVPPPVLGFGVGPPPFATEAEAKRLADEAAAKKAAADADAKRRAGADAAAAAAAAAKKAAEEAEAKRRADADAVARRTAEEAEAARRAAEAKRVADEAAAKKAAEDADARRRAEAETKRLADEAAARKAADDAEKKRIADAEAAAASARRAAADTAAKVCQDKLKAVTDLGAVRFRVASATIERASNATLDQLADVVKACPGNVIRVEGHTDSQGEPEFNLTLSRNRAQAVVDYLVRAGIAAELVSADGFGETRPLGDNGTADGRAQNRRIEFKVTPR